MKQYLLFILLTFSGISVQSQELVLKDIQVFNLEEDKGPFATMNDEIVVWVAKINTERDWIMSWEHTEEMIFSDSITNHSLANLPQLQIDSFDLVFITLIEMDNDNFPDSLDAQLKKVFLEFYGFPLTFLQERIRLTLEDDDDILGIAAFKFEDRKFKNEDLIFKGMHMFNRFEYKIGFGIGSEP